ncbi:MAG: hypothetical protein HOV68_07130, partial [Streptomycetaceae bacterium]|nr:hypothetical protein [Streptomycetaceae bacterium]
KSEVAARLLAHERRYWRGAARTQGIGDFSPETLEDAVAVAVATRPADRAAADLYLRVVPGLADQPRDRRDAVRAWISELFPSSEGTPWGRMYPDLLVERVLKERMTAHPELYVDLMIRMPRSDIRELMIYSWRSAEADKRAGGGFDGLLAGFVTRHAQSWPHYVLNDLSDWALADPGAPGGFAEDVAHALVRGATGRAGQWAALSNLAGVLVSRARFGEGVEVLEGAVRELLVESTAPDPAVLELGTAMTFNFAQALAGVGRGPEALTCVDEALSRFAKRLVRAKPEYRHWSALCVFLKGSLLREAGRGREADAAEQRAREAYPDGLLTETSWLHVRYADGES